MKRLLYCFPRDSGDLYSDGRGRRDGYGPRGRGRGRGRGRRYDSDRYGHGRLYTYCSKTTLLLHELEF